MAALLGMQAADTLATVFKYNRNNFQYDRAQRQKMEYELADMRLEQVGLWREDVRQFCSLTPAKLEIYLLIIALELGFCVMALAKARVPPGSPPWLVAMHTLSACGALMYLFLALWFGMHAFVSSQAYKVRILTQLVRLPVPSWRALEASRTYSSAYETLDTRQILRMPFVTGGQERQVQVAGAGGTAAGGPSDSRLDAGARNHRAGAATEDQIGSGDPWGLERRGDGISELKPDVNEAVERQRHVWLVREASKFYQSYDAFCRICMSLGTSSLSTFFCYYCMTYVLTENAAPVGACVGMMAFMFCSQWLLRNDLMLKGREYFIQGFLMFASPALSFVVTVECAHTKGHPRQFKPLVVVALLFHGISTVYNLMLFRVRETQSGTILPLSFRRVLFVDPFGWAKHTATWWRQMHANLRSSPTKELGRAFTARIESMVSLNSGSSSHSKNGQTEDLPSMQCASSARPMRPEEVDQHPTPSQQRPAGAEATDSLRTPSKFSAASPSEADLENVSFRPGSFAGVAQDASVTTGTDVQGQAPGHAPWRTFFQVTMVLSLLWFWAAGTSIYRIASGTAMFPPIKTAIYHQVGDGQVLPVAEMFTTGQKADTHWKMDVVDPVGLACDPEGKFFATSGRLADGRHGILHGRVSSDGGSENASWAVDFNFASACSHSDAPIQDLAMHACTAEGQCNALVLPRKGSHLISCPLKQPGAHDDEGVQTRAVGRAWLRDRGGVPLDGDVGKEDFFHPEELSSITAVPCSSATGGASSKHSANGECVVVGTTARRVLMLQERELAGKQATLVPQRLLQSDNRDVPRPGALALFQDRYLATLSQETNSLRVLDLHRGGRHTGTLELPAAQEQDGASKWAAVCGGGSYLYALTNGDKPAVYRFAMPSAENKDTHREEQRSI